MTAATHQWADSVFKSTAVREIVQAADIAVALTAIWPLIMPHAITSGGDTAHHLHLARDPSGRCTRRTRTGC